MFNTPAALACITCMISQGDEGSGLGSAEGASGFGSTRGSSGSAARPLPLVLASQSQSSLSSSSWNLQIVSESSAALASRTEALSSPTGAACTYNNRDGE